MGPNRLGWVGRREDMGEEGFGGGELGVTRSARVMVVCGVGRSGGLGWARVGHVHAGGGEPRAPAVGEGGSGRGAGEKGLGEEASPFHHGGDAATDDATAHASTTTRPCIRSFPFTPPHTAVSQLCPVSPPPTHPLHKPPRLLFEQTHPFPSPNPGLQASSTHSQPPTHPNPLTQPHSREHGHG